MKRALITPGAGTRPVSFNLHFNEFISMQAINALADKKDVEGAQEFLDLSHFSSGHQYSKLNYFMQL